MNRHYISKLMHDRGENGEVLIEESKFTSTIT